MRFADGELEIKEGALQINWLGGRQQVLSASFLRSQCPCAVCRNASILLEPSMFPGLKISGLDLVGSYAVQLGFSDQHSQGAFSFDRLAAYPDRA